MEVSVLKLCFILVIILMAIRAWRVLNWVWLRPKKLEKYLRQQGLKGTPYRVLFGDLKESVKMTAEATSKPISLFDDIVHRVSPHLLHIVNNYEFFYLGGSDTDFQRPRTNPLVLLLASGLASSEGEKWAKHRKIINPAFHMEKLKHMLPAFYLSCNEMLSKWESSLNHEESCELDVWPYLQNMTADVISRTAFGSSYEEGRRIFQLQKEQTNLVLKATQTLYVPGWRFVPTKLHKRMKEIANEVEALLKDLIHKRENAMRAGEAPSNDLLGILIESNFKEIQQHGNNKNVGMSIKDVIKECKLFYFSGQETTAVLLVWTMVLLSKYPNWQTRAREEVLQVFGDNNPDFDGLVHLKVVNMILYEVLRLYPPLLVLNRTVGKNTQLGKFSLLAGMEVSLPIFLMNHDPDLWGEDAKEFNPERFADGLSKVTKGQVSFFPFGWGPRICIGQNFAIIEAKMALALILQRFTVELSPSYTHAPFVIITLQPQYGAHLILHKR